MHALRRFHAALVPGGLLIDLRPTAENVRAVGGGVELGRFDARELRRDCLLCDAALEILVGEGLFAAGAVRTFERADRFETAGSLIAEAVGWPRVHLSAALGDAVLAAAPPYEVRQPVTLRVFHAR